MVNTNKLLFFLGHLIVAAYLINMPFNFFAIPESITKYNPWIAAVGGLLILVGGINYLRAGRKQPVQK